MSRPDSPVGASRKPGCSEPSLSHRFLVGSTLVLERVESAELGPLSWTRKAVEESRMPAWLDDARWYYSEIGEESAQPVSVFTMAESVEVSSESPGTLCLRLEPRSRFSPLVQVLDPGGREGGIIRSEGFLPGMRYAMFIKSECVWILSVRSIVRKRHTLELAHGGSWTFDTPFFWWQHLTGTAFGTPRLLGCVGPTKWFWLMCIEPGRDTFDLLAAVAFMHRQWWHS